MADQKVKLEAVISATSQGMVDALKRASAAVNDSTASWKDRFSRAKGDLSTVSEAVKNLTSAVGQIGDVDIGTDPQSVSRLRDMLAGLQGVFASTRGDVESLSSALVAMRQEASALGMPVEEYQRFSEVVQAVGMDIGQAGQMMQSMRQRIQDFANGVPEAVDMFGRLGITLEQLGGRSPVQNMAAIAQAIQVIVPATEQAAASARMYGRSMQDVLRVSQEYTKALASNGGAQYASDNDVQRAIGLADALGRVGQSLDAVAGRLAGVEQDQSRMSEGARIVSESYRSVLDALDAYNAKLAESARQTYDVGVAYKGLEDSVRRMREASKAATGDFGDDEDMTRYVMALDGVRAKVEDFRGKLSAEMVAVREIMSKRLAAGAPIDTKELDDLVSHINAVRDAIDAMRQHGGTQGVGYASQFAGMRDELTGFLHDLSQIQDQVSSANWDFDIGPALKEAQGLYEEMQRISSTDVRVRPQVDMDRIAALERRLESLKAMRVQIIDKAGTEAAYSDLTDRVTRIRALLAASTAEQERFNAEARNGVSVWTMMGRGVKSVWSVIRHPVDAAHRLAEHVRQAWQWMTRFKSASSDAGRAVDTTGKQLGQVAGMLTGMGSKVMIIVKGFRAMADAVKEIAKWWTEAEKRRAEFNGDLAKDATSQFQANRKEAEDRMRLSQNYAEAVSKANRSGKAEDRASAEVIRKELWEKYGVRANPDTARKVFREQSESYYDTMVSQNESETNMYRELVTQYRKALEERKKYLSDIFGKGLDLSQKLGEDTVYTDLTKKMGEAQKRLGELTVERTWLGRKRRGGEYADYVAVNGGMNDDAMREMIRKEDERRDKLISDREKAAEKASGDLSDWSAQVTMDDVDRQIRDVWKKYNEIVKAGGDRQKAYQVAVEAIRKIREDAEKRDADELKKLADEHEHQVESLQRAREQEQDAQKRLLESYKALYEAQENEAYRIRLEDIGKARERLRKKMDRFGFTLPDGFKSSRPNMTPGERRAVRMDDRIADKLARRQAGERVHFTSRELERIRALERLQKRDKSLSAEERQIRAAQTQASAAKTMKSASEQFWQAVKAFFEAATGKQLESEKEKDARKKKERRERARRKNEERRRPPEQKGESRPSGRSPSPAARADGSKEEARPAGARPGPPSSTGNYPPVFLDWESYLAKFKGSPQDAAEYYRKYVEMFNRMHGTSHEYKVGEFPNPYPEPEKQSGGVKLPPEYDDATRHQRAVAEWNRRNHPDDYDDEGNWKYSENGMARERDRMQADAVQEPVYKVVQPVDTVEQPVEQKVQPVGTTVQPVERKIQPVEARTQPVEEVEQPVQRIEQPVQVSEQPVETRTMPVEQAVQPVDTKTQPVDVQTQPVDTVKQPVDVQKQPVDVQKQPVDTVKQPVEEKEQPVDVKTMPVDAVTQPVEVAVQPVETRTMPVASVEQPVATVEQPVQERTQPVDEKMMPVETKVQPVEAKEQPVATETQPVDIQTQPVETKVQPFGQSTQPVETREQPVSTQVQPVDAVEQPVATVEQPVDIQTQPVDTVEQPVASVEQPVERIEQPVEVAVQPVDQVIQPVGTMVQPVDVVEQPVEVKTMPVEVTTQPVEQVEQPVQVTMQPVDRVVQPVETSVQPVEQVEQPVEVRTMPVASVLQPVDTVEQPVETKTMPVDTVTQPVEQALQPVDKVKQPVEVTTMPVDKVIQPVEEKVQPVGSVKQPVEIATMPVDRVVQPVATVVQPVDERTQPVDQVVQPVEVNEQPVATVVQPVASAIQPVEVKTMPVERVVQPVEDKTLEVDASSLDRRLADLRAPSRLGGDGSMNMPDHDYTGLLEGIKRAIEAGNKSKFTVV